MPYFNPNTSLEELGVIPHVVNRIYQLLPSQSGLTLIDVEDDTTIFLTGRKALLNVAEFGRFDEVLKYIIELIGTLNEADNYLVLKQRSVASLSSILIIVRLLADLSEVNWEAREPSKRKNSMESNYSSSSTNSSLGVGFSTIACEFHTVQPSKLDSQCALKAVSVLSKLKSTNSLTQELALMNGKMLFQSSLYEDIATRPLIDQIDTNCEILLRYIAASNPGDFFQFIKSKVNILKHNISNEADFAQYLELFSCIYLTEDSLLDYLKELRAIMSSLRKDSYRQLVFSFLLKSIKTWIQARPVDFLNSSKSESPVSIEAEALFDEVLASTDTISSGKASYHQSQRQFRSSFKFLAFLLALFPKALQQFLSDRSPSIGSNPLKRIANFNTNKKQKLLSSIIKQLSQPKDSNDNASILESLDFMVFIASVASETFKADPTNAVVKFSLNFSDMVSEVLVPIASNRASAFISSPSGIELVFFNHLKLNYFSSLCVLAPQQFFPQLLTILHDENICYERLNIACSILKIYSSSRSLDKIRQQYVIKVLPALRAVMVRVSTMVRSSSLSESEYGYDDDDLTTLQKTASSNSGDIHPIGPYKSLLDTQNKSLYSKKESLRSPSTASSGISIPKAEKSRSFFRNHYSSSSNTVQSAPAPCDDNKSMESKEWSRRSAHLSRGILTNGFEIFKKHPHHYMYTFEESPIAEKVSWLINTMSDLSEPFIVGLNDSNAELRTAAKNFIHAYFVTTNVTDNADATVAAFTGSAMIAYRLAKFVLNNFSSDSRKKDVFESFVRMMELRINMHTILEQHSFFHEVKQSELPYSQRIHSFMEEALIFALTIADQENYSLIKRGVFAYTREFQLNEMLDNTESYSDIKFLTSVAEDKMVTTGSIALHKNIQKHFARISKATPAVCASFNRIYDRWYTFAKSEYSELTSIELMDFRNFAGYLASTAGLFVHIDVESELRDSFSDRVITFINQQLSMLSNENLVTRENAKEILASETTYRAHTTIMTLLRPFVESLAEKKYLSGMDLNVTELLIVLMKVILDGGDDTTLFLVSVDIIDCATIIAKVIDSIKEIDKTTLKLKMRCSLLFHKIQIHSEQLRIQSAFSLRNQLLRIVFNWFESAVSYEYNQSKPDQSHSSNQIKDLSYLYIDLTLESAKAMSVLLDSLLLEASKVVNEHELNFYKSRIFSLYFNSLLKAMEKYTNAESFAISIRHKVSTISEYITVSLTNLLKSNVDVGLAFALPIGYHPNSKVRISFLKVFTSIVASYSRDSPDKLAARKLFAISAFKDSLENPSFFSCVGRACPPLEASALTSTILSLANSFNQSAVLVSYLLDEEIKSSSSYTDILRRNSFASRSLSAFDRIKGTDYLISTLRPIMTEIRDSEAELEVEKIDVDDPYAERNLNNFFHYLRKLVNVITGSIDQIPLEFKKVCQTIAKSVSEKFPNYKMIAVGSFIFLRFFCPAIVSPETDGIVDIPNRQTQRKFLLLAKVLQNMASGSISSIRWPLVKQRERDLLELNEKIISFLERVSSQDEIIEFEYVQPDSIDENIFSFFHNFLYEHWKTIRSELNRTYRSTDDALFGKTMATTVMSVLRIAGQPTVNFGYEIPSSITPENNAELYEFMSKYSMKDMGSIIDNEFIRQDFSQDGSPLLVFSYRDFHKIASDDEELALYRIFQVASKIWEKKFAMVVDCTGFDINSHNPTRAQTLFGTLAPPQMYDNCTDIYFYNVSSSYYKRLLVNLKNPYFFTNSPKFKVHFRSAMDDKKTVFNLGLPKPSVKSYHDVRVKFNDVSIYQKEYNRFVGVIVKVGNETLQICQTTPKHIKLKDGIKSIYLNDVYRLDAITSVAATDTTKVPNEITLIFENGDEVILSSPKYLEIMRLLYFTRNRTSNSLGSEPSLTERPGKNVEDLLGQLFNVIFLGLTSSSAEIRGIAYNLLVVTQKSFNIDLGRGLHQLHDVHFPTDNNSFVVAMSEKLSMRVPEITFEFVDSFFQVYAESITSRQRLSAILYVAPWVDNIYDHVFKVDDEHGADFVAELIRKFLKVSGLDPAFSSAFNSSFWSKLCLQEKISPILVNEVVLAAIDREAEGVDWASTISLLTSTPTIELFSCVIKRLRDISHIPFPDEKGVYSIAAHSNWVEITVLVQMAVSLVFDNHVYAEMFLADVFYIVTIFVDVGPLELRVASHQLLLNLLQAFFSDPKLDEKSRSVIYSAVEQFTTHRSRLLFGLNRDNEDNFLKDLDRFSTKISAVESLVTLLVDTIENCPAFTNVKTVWISRWNRYVIDAAVRKDSILRGRALLLLGALSTRGMNDNMIIKILEMIHQESVPNISDPRFLYLGICTIFSMSKISIGLLKSSQLFSQLFWWAFSITHSVHASVYQAGLQFLTNILESMNSHGKFEDNDILGYLLKGKEVFYPVMAQVEELAGITVSEENFDLTLLNFAAKGLQVSYFRTTSVECLKAFFRVRYINECQRIQNHPEIKFDQRPTVYLLFLFMLMKQDDLKEFLKECGVEEDFIFIDEGTYLPKILANYVLSGSEQSHIMLVFGAIYFNEGNGNEKSMVRYLQVLKFASKRNSKLLMNVYYEIQLTLRRIVQHSIGMDLINEIFEVASIAYTSEGYYDQVRLRGVTDTLLQKYKIAAVRNYQFLKNGKMDKHIDTRENNRCQLLQEVIGRILDSCFETA